MKKLTEEEKKSRHKARDEAAHNEKCRALYVYWDKFYDNIQSQHTDDDKKAIEARNHANGGSYSDMRRILEIIKCRIISNTISSTHNWVRQEHWLRCRDCGYQATREAYRELDQPIIELDTNPNYDMENNVIHYTCEELRIRYNERKEKKYCRCKQCGVWGCPYWYAGKSNRKYKI